MTPAPFAVGPDDVARAIETGVRAPLDRLGSVDAGCVPRPAGASSSDLAANADGSSMTTAAGRTALVSGWGRSSPSSSTIIEGATLDEARDLLRTVAERGLLVRGLGRAYGDAAQNGGGALLELDRSAPVCLDGKTGLVTAGAGVSFDRLMRDLVPQGWFVPVTPGARQITVGGAVQPMSTARTITSMVHGAPHRVDDDPHGRRVNREVAPSDPTRLFWATVGGMGLTGIVLACTFRARPVSTSRMLVDTERTNCLDETVARLTEYDHRRSYSVAWLDVLARGRALGRAVITAGDHAPVEALAVDDLTNALDFVPRTLPALPDLMPSRLLSSLTVAAFNAFWYRRARSRRSDELQSIATFFHPVDAMPNWNILYGSRGFIQYQFVVPHDALGTLVEVVERLSMARIPSFLTVLKRLGPSNAGMLSFPMPGWPLTLDIPAGTAGLAELLDTLDVLVLDAGGRENLAKMPEWTARRWRRYPRLDEWKGFAEVDPTGLFQSDQGRRLGLCQARCD
jgi:decaprenylphospho-beta-D-ribofuranose 2-oxidase